MKKLIISAIVTLLFANLSFANEVNYSIKELKKLNIDANAPISKADYQKAQKTMLNIYKKTDEGVKNGKGPFYAEVYDEYGNLVAAASNSVVETQCALHHAEVNTLNEVHKKLQTYDLAPQNLTIYVNAEPCIMCAGAIMWSGVKTIYFGVPSKSVEKITGFDEGYKPNWIKEFKKRGITVYGNIEQKEGEKVLYDYVANGNKIYKPSRDEVLVGLANPWTDCNTDFKCAEKIAGFSFPLSLSNYSIRAMKGMIEITYPIDEHRNVTIRKGMDESNNCDNSGDYNKYTQNTVLTLSNGVNINTRGDKDKIYVMFFAAESGVYSARCEQGISAKEVEDIYNILREAEEPKDF